MTLDLSARIKMIDQMANRGGVVTATSKIEEAREEQAEESLVQHLDEDVATAEPVASASDKTQEILDAIAELKAEVTKMNKHVNSIQKFIKKEMK